MRLWEKKKLPLSGRNCSPKVPRGIITHHANYPETFVGVGRQINTEIREFVAFFPSNQRPCSSFFFPLAPLFERLLVSRVVHEEPQGEEVHEFAEAEHAEADA